MQYQRTVHDTNKAPIVDIGSAIFLNVFQDNSMEHFTSREQNTYEENYSFDCL